MPRRTRLRTGRTATASSRMGSGYPEVPPGHGRDVGDGPRAVAQALGWRLDPAEGQGPLRVAVMQRAVAAAADVVDPAPVRELVAGRRAEQHVARRLAPHGGPHARQGVRVLAAAQDAPLLAGRQDVELAGDVPRLP